MLTRAWPAEDLFGSLVIVSLLGLAEHQYKDKSVN